MSQTITRNDGNVSVYVFDDSVNVDLSATPNATVRNNSGNDFDIGDLNASNATLHSGVTAPSGWQGGKHTYDGSSWGDVSGWVDPAAGMLEQDKVRYAATPHTVLLSQTQYRLKQTVLKRCRQRL